MPLILTVGMKSFLKVELNLSILFYVSTMFHICQSTACVFILYFHEYNSQLTQY